ncbi:STAS domain-containing protein [Rhizobiaceae bacterium n13]|uniref:STAS domain-containing protein n=1 Tax=Ferirhizobium litorale TaxID=2927786 RepID=A0AAE3QCI4_9HYPH|nr:STAS domain-containing protein [Fererhizobium litorale]MDI7863372.1 STAS domain-containing protein [Fererhizobium litorale]MDI7922351.1 STAS domain-containing protein [Fererhizobium litorale]
MASKKGEQGSLKLPAVLDLNEATQLHGKLMSLRGKALVIDASAVERAGIQCIQVLLAGAKAWGEDKKPFSIAKVSDAFQKTLQLVGMSADQLQAQEIR